MEVKALKLTEDQWHRFHSEGDAEDVFFVVKEAANLSEDGDIILNDFPLLAYQATVFFQAYAAFDGRYTARNPFHGYTADCDTKAGFMRNVSAMRDFVTTLGAEAWRDFLTNILVCAEAMPEDGFADTFGGTVPGGQPRKLYDLVYDSGLEALLHTDGHGEADLEKRAAAYVQKNCPVVRLSSIQ